jgi:hypothetical protein
MIHRIHKYSVDYRSGIGAFLGYVNLCNGYIDVSHIYENLIRSNLISSSWFQKKELNIVANGATTLGNQIWILQRRTPREHLFVIYPIELEEKQIKNDWPPGDYFKHNFAATADSATTYSWTNTVPNPGYYIQHIQQQAYIQQPNPIMFQPITFTVNNPIVQAPPPAQVHQIIVDDPMRDNIDDE